MASDDTAFNMKSMHCSSSRQDIEGSSSDKTCSSHYTNKPISDSVNESVVCTSLQREDPNVNGSQSINRDGGYLTCSQSCHQQSELLEMGKNDILDKQTSLSHRKCCGKIGGYIHDRKESLSNDMCSNTNGTRLFGENDSSGYVTSPDISSEEESKLDGNISGSTNCVSGVTKPKESKLKDSAPVTLSRHHLKPTLERLGCSLDSRLQMLEKQKEICLKMGGGFDRRNEDLKHSGFGRIKERRSKREKIDGDFSGSCKDKVSYNEEEKPSLKKHEPVNVEPTPPKVNKVTQKNGKKVNKDKQKQAKENVSQSCKHTREKVIESDSNFDKKSRSNVGTSAKEVSIEPLSSHKPGQDGLNTFDALKQQKPKPKVKHHRNTGPPPINFADLMKLAEEKKEQPVMLKVCSKTEKERRPRTQEELDRELARKERVKIQENRDGCMLARLPGKDLSLSGVRSSQLGRPVVEEYVVSSNSTSSASYANKAGIPQSVRKSCTLPVSSKKIPELSSTGSKSQNTHKLYTNPGSYGTHRCDMKPEKLKLASSISDSTKSLEAPSKLAASTNPWDRLFCQPEYRKSHSVGKLALLTS